MIQTFALKERQIEFVGHEAGRDVLGKLGMSLHCREATRSAAFGGYRIRIADPKGKVGNAARHWRTGS